MAETITDPTCRNPYCRVPPTPGYADRGLCDACERRGRDALGDLPHEYARLLPLVREKPRGGLSTFGGKPGPSEPLNLHAEALCREIEYVIGQWEEIIRDRVRISPAATLDVRKACRTLGGFWPALIACPPVAVTYPDPDRTIGDQDGPAAIVAITALYRRAVAAVGQTPGIIELAGICPGEDCGRPALRHLDGDDGEPGRGAVWCDYCRRHWTWDDYARYVELVNLGALR
jgi:hypothetical protein